jgi:hypothetical protein
VLLGRDLSSWKELDERQLSTTHGYESGQEMLEAVIGRTDASRIVY